MNNEKHAKKIAALVESFRLVPLHLLAQLIALENGELSWKTRKNNLKIDHSLQWGEEELMAVNEHWNDTMDDNCVFAMRYTKAEVQEAFRSL